MPRGRCAAYPSGPEGTCDVPGGGQRARPSKRAVCPLAITGFNLEKFVNGEIRKLLGPDSGATLAAFRAVQNSTSTPPRPKPSWLGEVVVHSEDIRRPLGISHAYDPAAVRQVADSYKGSDTLIGSKNRIAGLTLTATDQDWSHGQGPVVEGPLLSLLMAMTGRSAHITNLAGDGVETLRGGLRPPSPVVAGTCRKDTKPQFSP